MVDNPFFKHMGSHTFTQSGVTPHPTYTMHTHRLGHMNLYSGKHTVFPILSYLVLCPHSRVHRPHIDSHSRSYTLTMHTLTSLASSLSQSPSRNYQVYAPQKYVHMKENFSFVQVWKCKNGAPCLPLHASNCRPHKDVLNDQHFNSSVSSGCGNAGRAEGQFMRL